MTQDNEFMNNGENPEVNRDAAKEAQQQPFNQPQQANAQQPYAQPQQPYQQPQQPYQQPQQQYQQPQQQFQQPQQPYQQGSPQQPYGQPQQGQPYQQQAYQAPAEPGALGGMQANMASMLSYLFGWITGLIFYFGDKRPIVRFNAAQSIIVSGALVVVNILLSILRIGLWRLWWAFSGISTIIWLIQLAFIVYMMIQAYNGKKVKLPVAGDMAEKWANK